MNRGSTFFLKVVIYLIGLAVLALLVIFASVIYAGNAGMYLPMLLGMFVPAIPFYMALYQGLQLLKYIDTNTAFSEKSVRTLKTIKYCAFTISGLYALGMPLIIYVADKDDAPGAVLVGLVFTIVPLIVGVFAAVLERLMQNALDIKSENDLTV
ncbi:MAG: DUF2975 domain-containing protein [Patescibacteria group bacterium]